MSSVHIKQQVVVTSKHQSVLQLLRNHREHDDVDVEATGWRSLLSQQDENLFKWIRAHFIVVVWKIKDHDE